MSPGLAPGAPRAGGDALRRALVLLAVATTVVVATEFIAIGLLPVLARDLGTSLTEAGHLVAAFALAAGLLGPPLTLVLSSQPPRRVLAGALLVFAAGNLAAVLWPTYPVLMAVRIIQGAALPVFVSIGTATVTALAPPGRRSRALADANLGFVLGVVVALPAGVALAEGGAWAPSFLVLAALALGAAALVALAYPVVATAAPPPVARQAALLASPLFAGHALFSVAVFAAMFAPYTYLAAWLEHAAGLSAQGIALALAAFGLAGLVGNTLAGRLADAAPLSATLAVTAVVAATAIGLALAPSALIPLIVLWGAAQTAAVALCQIRVTLAGGAAPAFAMSINISAANLGIAVGAVAGGMVVDTFGLGAIGWGAAALLAPAAASAWLTHALAVARPQAGSGVCRGR